MPIIRVKDLAKISSVLVVPLVYSVKPNSVEMPLSLSIRYGLEPSLIVDPGPS